MFAHVGISAGALHRRARAVPLRTVLTTGRGLQHPAATVLVTPDRGDARAPADTAAHARLLGSTDLVPPGVTGREVPLAARPEDCRIVDPAALRPGSDPPVIVRGTLRRSVVLGDVVRIDVDVPSRSITCLQPSGSGSPPPGPPPPSA